jgi:hypothetical protein
MMRLPHCDAQHGAVWRIKFSQTDLNNRSDKLNMGPGIKCCGPDTGRPASSNFRSRMLWPGYNLQKSYPIPLMTAALAQVFSSDAPTLWSTIGRPYAGLFRALARDKRSGTGAALPPKC